MQQMCLWLSTTTHRHRKCSKRSFNCRSNLRIRTYTFSAVSNLLEMISCIGIKHVYPVLQHGYQVNQGGQSAVIATFRPLLQCGNCCPGLSRIGRKSLVIKLLVGLSVVCRKKRQGSCIT